MAGVPWYYDERRRAYRVRPGFKLQGLTSPRTQASAPPDSTSAQLLAATGKVLDDGEQFFGSLRHFYLMLESRVEAEADAK